MAQTMAVNAIAPFVICSLLKESMMPPCPLINEKKEKINNNGKKNENNCENGNKNTENTENIGRTLDLCYSHIVNVTALEGKFNVGKKSGGHPHTVTWTKKCSIYYTFLLPFLDMLF